MRAAHRVVHDTEAPGAAGEVHLGPPEKFKGHTRPQEDPDTKFKWWGWRYVVGEQVVAFLMVSKCLTVGAVPLSCSIVLRMATSVTRLTNVIHESIKVAVLLRM